MATEKEGPVLFNGIPVVGRMSLFREDMRQATRERRKGQTRRVMKPQPVFEHGLWRWKKTAWDEAGALISDLAPVDLCPYGEVGDIRCMCEPLIRGPDGIAYYREDMAVVISLITGKSIPWRWKRQYLASIHMPTEAARIVRRYTDIRVERLQDISEEDAIAEGIQWLRNELDGIYQWKIPGDKDGWFDYVTDAFRYLWDSINKKRGHGWDSNDWVWPIEFKVVKNND